MVNSREASTGPPSSSAVARMILTPQEEALSRTAQSSAFGPLSPGGPGCTIRQGTDFQTSSGILRLRNGAITASGPNSETASRVTSSVISSSTETSWPARSSSAKTRWLRELNAWQRISRRIVQYRLESSTALTTKDTKSTKKEQAADHSSRGQTAWSGLL